MVSQSGPFFARPAPEQPAIKAQAVFRESVHWRDPLRGAMEPTEKEQADAKEIGGLRNSSESFCRLSFTSAYGCKLGEILKNALDEQQAWIDQTCEAIGTNDDDQIAAGLEPMR